MTPELMVTGVRSRSDAPAATGGQDVLTLIDDGPALTGKVVDDR